MKDNCYWSTHLSWLHLRLYHDQESRPTLERQWSHHCLLTCRDLSWFQAALEHWHSGSYSHLYLSRAGYSLRRYGSSTRISIESHSSAGIFACYNQSRPHGFLCWRQEAVACSFYWSFDGYDSLEMKCRAPNTSASCHALVLYSGIGRVQGREIQTESTLLVSSD